MQPLYPSTRPHPALLLASAAGLSLLTSQALAFDARSIALGGASVANGLGVHGAIENPASLAAAKRRGDKAHFLLGGALDGRDHSSLIDTVTDTDNQDLADDIEDEIDALSGSTVADECAGAGFITAPDDTVCLSGTGELSNLSERALDLVNDIDGNPIEGLGQGQLGVAISSTALPFAIHLSGRATGFGEADIADSDRGYINDFIELLDDDTLTLGEIRDSDQFAISATTIDVTQPEEAIESSGEGGAMVRAQFGISLATSIELGDYLVDIGATTKFSSLTAFGLAAEFSDAFDDAVESLEDQLEDSETQESSFTFDVGASTRLQNRPMSLSAVLRNIVPESIETPDGIEFETTPQLLTGVAYELNRVTLMASAAINSAELDGITTHPVALGVEFASGAFAVRGGLSADLGRDDDVVALSAGVKLGPIDISGRLASPTQGQVGVQLAFGF